MSSVNAMRGLLVAGAAFAALVAAFFQLWSVVVIFGVGIAAHAALSVYLRRSGALASTPGRAAPPSPGRAAPPSTDASGPPTP